MVATPEYSIQTQAKIVHAICALHNFVRIHDPEDIPDDEKEAELNRLPAERQLEDFRTNISAEEKERASMR